MVSTDKGFELYKDTCFNDSEIGTTPLQGTNSVPCLEVQIITLNNLSS